MASKTPSVQAVLQAIQRDRDLSLRQMSDMTGVSFSYLGGILRGTRSPSPKVIHKLARGLGREARPLLENLRVNEAHKRQAEINRGTWQKFADKQGEDMVVASHLAMEVMALRLALNVRGALMEGRSTSGLAREARQMLRLVEVTGASKAVEVLQQATKEAGE